MLSIYERHTDYFHLAAGWTQQSSPRAAEEPHTHIRQARRHKHGRREGGTERTGRGETDRKRERTEA